MSKIFNDFAHKIRNKKTGKYSRVVFNLYKKSKDDSFKFKKICFVKFKKNKIYSRFLGFGKLHIWGINKLDDTLIDKYVKELKDVS